MRRFLLAAIAAVLVLSACSGGTKGKPPVPAVSGTVVGVSLSANAANRYMAAGAVWNVFCPNKLTSSQIASNEVHLVCAVPATTTTAPATTTTVAPTTTRPATTTTLPGGTTTVPATTTTTVPATTTTVPTSGTCTSPVWSSSDAQATDNTDSAGYWWVNNDAWSGSHGPQTINVCSASSWYAVSNQTDQQGAVETYPDTEYFVGGGGGGHTTKTISQFASITSTFSEAFPTTTGLSWDAGYDLWTNNWTNETMIWNQWVGDPGYWPGQATIAVTLDGVPYHFLDNGGELLFFRDTQVASGSVDILAAYQWEVAHGYAKATDIPTNLEYGVEVVGTNGATTFPLTGLTFSLS